jgi:phage terminase small subunit
MTPRQRFFVLEYLIDLNGEQAAIRAGYVPSNARSQAARLMSYPEVAAAIRTEMAERAQRTGITAERVIAEYARIAFADMGSLADDWDVDKVLYKPSAELSDEAAAIIAYIAELAGPEGHRLEVKTFDKRRALESLARIFGLNVASFSSFELGAHHA